MSRVKGNSASNEKVIYAMSTHQNAMKIIVSFIRKYFLESQFKGIKHFFEKQRK